MSANGAAIGDQSSGTAHPSAGQRRSYQAEEEPEDFASKRQRTNLACESCRNRKSRCDGARPICTACSSMGFHCVYRRPVPPAAQQQSRFSQMESRLQALEDMLQSGSNHDNTLEASTNGNPPQLPSAISQSNIQVNDTAGGTEARIAPNNDRDEDSVDGMGAITFSGESTSLFFGSSSNSAFAALIAKIPGQREQRINDHNGAVSRPSSPVLPPQPIHQEAVNPYALPPHEEILRLVNRWFSVTGCFFPYINKAESYETIHKMRFSTSPTVRKSWLSLLNAMMACGLSLILPESQDVVGDETQAHTYFKRAYQLSPWFESSSANLETVQALAVMTQYCEGTSRSAEAWKLHGNLMHAALQIGVSVEDSARKCAPLQREVQRRTWHMCVQMDRMLSSTLGRPLIITNSSNRVSLPTDAYELSGQDSSEVFGDAVYGRLFVETIKLNRILSDAIEELFDQNLRSSLSLNGAELYTAVVKFDERLHEWEQQINQDLKIGGYACIITSQLSQYSRPQLILKLRYLSTRLLIYRRILDDYLIRISSGSWVGQTKPLDAMGQFYVKSCSEISQEIIEIVSEERFQDMLPSWWFSVYYLLQSSLVIFGTLVILRSGCCSDVTTSFDVTGKLDIAVRAVDRIAKGTRLARRCSKYISAIIHASSAILQSRAEAIPDHSFTDTTTDISSTTGLWSGDSFGFLSQDFGLFLQDNNFDFLNL